MASTVTTLVAAAGDTGRQFQPGQFPQGGPPGGFGGRPPGMGGASRMLLGPFGGTAMLLILGITLVVLAVVFWKVFSKTGRSGALGLLMLVPVVNWGVMVWLAFSPWPIEAEVERLKTALAVQAARPNAPLPEQE